MKVSLFLGIFALYLLTLDINTTVSTAPVQQNISTHWTLSGAYPPSQRILASRASVGAPQET